MLIRKVVTTENAGAEMENWKTQSPHLNLGVTDLLRAPQVLAGSVDEITERLLEQRERFGFTYFTVFEPAMETFAPVLRALSTPR